MPGVKLSGHRQGIATVPSFCKILDGDFYDHLLIPVDFLEHFENIMYEKFTLTNHAEKSWNVHVLKTEETIYIKEGWPEFLRENGLGVGNVLIFHYNGNGCFHIAMYEEHGCEKKTI